MSISGFSPNFGMSGMPQIYPQNQFASSPSLAGVSGVGSGNPLLSPGAMMPNSPGAMADPSSLFGGNSIQGLGNGSMSTILQAIIGMMVSMISMLFSMLQGGNPADSSGGGANGSPSDGSGASPSADSSGNNGQAGGCHGGGCQGGASGGNPPDTNGDSGGGNSPPPAKSAPPPSDPSGSSGSGGGGSAEQQQFLQLINNLRAQHGLKPVKLNDKLNQTATDYAGAMNSAGQMTHTLNGTQFGDRIKQHGYNWSTATENIAEGQQSVQDAFNAWCSDQGHLDNLLASGVTEIGLGHVGNMWDQEGAAPG